MKASVEEYNSENGYGSENVDVWTIFQGHSQSRFRACPVRVGLKRFLSSDATQYGDHDIFLP